MNQQEGPKKPTTNPVTPIVYLFAMNTFKVHYELNEKGKSQKKFLVVEPL